MSEATVSRITSKGQITIPQTVRERYHLQPGDQVEFRISEEGVIELRRIGGDLRSLAGFLGTPRHKASLDELDEGIEQHLREEYHVRR